MCVGIVHWDASSPGMFVYRFYVCYAAPPSLAVRFMHWNVHFVCTSPIVSSEVVESLHLTCPVGLRIFQQQISHAYNYEQLKVKVTKPHSAH